MVTVTIRSAGVSPVNVSVPGGAVVRFVNQSATSHQIQSDPHPFHTDCPAVNQLPFLAPGQAGQTGPMPAGRTCGYHDHLDPTNAAWQGTITVTP